MARHELADGADEWDHDERGVSFATSLHWNMAIGRRYVLPNSHASCDCRSYAEHHARWEGMPYTRPCFGPLATVVLEKHLVAELGARQLHQRMPWVSMQQFYDALHDDRGLWRRAGG